MEIACKSFGVRLSKNLLSGFLTIGLLLGLMFSLSACGTSNTWSPGDALKNIKLPTSIPQGFPAWPGRKAPATVQTPVVQAPVAQPTVVQQAQANNLGFPQPVSPAPLYSTPQLMNAPIQIAPIQQQASLTNPTYTSTTYVQRNGKAKVGLLLPTGAGGNIGSVARQMRNAALLARDDAGSVIDLNFYDTQSTDGAAMGAVNKALNEGSELILGPLLGANVGQVAAQANARNVNLVSFSNDLSQARPGAYLLGIAPDLAVQQVVSYAAQRGIRRVAVLAPRSNYGDRAFAAAQDTAFQTGVQLIGPFSYNPDSGSDERKSIAKVLADQSDNFDAILIADNAQSSREMAALLVFNQIDLTAKRVLGTNLWIDPVVQQEAGLRGAWFAAAPEHDWKAFQSRYAARFGEQPEKIAGIAYDAATLASTLVRQGQGFDSNTLTSPVGFKGLFGGYRFSPSGHPIRAMDILEIRSGGTTVLQPAAGFAAFGS